MPMNDETAICQSERLIAMLSSLSNTQRLLTLSALDYQTLGLAKRHEKENAIELADQVSKTVAVLLRLLHKKIGQLVDESVPVLPK